jgi:hypothetical protein
MLSERLEVRLDEETMERVKREAEVRRVSVGELVREAIVGYLDEDRRRRVEAAEQLCALGEGLEGREPDWEEIEKEMSDAYLAEFGEIPLPPEDEE